MVAPDIENAVAAQKIEIRLVIHVVEVRALCPRIDFVESDHALRSHQCAVQVPLVKLIILTQSRANNLLKIQGHSQFSAIRDGNANCQGQPSALLYIAARGLRLPAGGYPCAL